MNDIFNICNHRRLIVASFLLTVSLIQPFRLFSKQQSKYPFYLHSVFEWTDPRIVDYSFIDLENDGVDEILLLLKEESVKYSLRFFRDLYRLRIGNRSYAQEDVIHVDNLTRYFRTPKGEPRICIITKLDSTIYLEILDRNLELITKVPVITGYDNNKNGMWDGYATPVIVRDLNNDNYPEVILEIFSGYDMQPRGISAIDTRHESILWEYRTAHDVGSINVFDLDNDGFLEIIFGGGTPGNGAVVDDMDDYHSYFIILNSKGEQIWRREVGGHNSSILPKILEMPDGESSKILTLFSTRNPEDVDATFGLIAIRNARTRSVEREHHTISHPKRCVLMDINNDGRKEIIISTIARQPEIIIFSDTLSIIHRVNIPFYDQHILVNDINLDGSVEIIVSDNSKNETIIFNNRLETMTHVDIGGKLYILHQGFSSPRLLAIFRPGEGVFYYNLLKTPFTQRFPILFIGIGLCIGVIVLLIIMIGARYRFPLVKRRIVQDIFNGISDGIIWIDRKQRVRFLNATAHALLGLEVSNPLKSLRYKYTNHKSVQKLLSLGKSNKEYSEEMFSRENVILGSKELTVVRIPYRSKIHNYGFIYVLEDQTKQNQARKIMLWSGLAQKLAHEIKNPLSTILLTLQRLKMTCEEDKLENIKTYDDYTESAIKEITKLRKVTDGFMKFTKVKTPDYKIENIDQIVADLEIKIKKWLPEDIQYKSDIEANLPNICVDLQQIDSLFFNLIDNALKSMGKKGYLTLRATKTESVTDKVECIKKTMVRFEIIDTGCGIEKEDIKTIFEPYVSYREDGTGLGLTISREIVESHDGSISVSSKKNIGTTIIVELPAVEDEE